MSDGSWWQVLVTLAYSIGGAIVPVFNGEVYIAAVLATGLMGPVSVGTCLGVGQGIGKLVVFQLVRRGRRLPRWRRHDRTGASSKPGRPPGVWRQRWQRVARAATRLVEHPRLGPLGVFLSGSLSLPPNYATTLIAGTTRMSSWVFGASMTAGFTLRYLLIALAGAGIIDRVF